MGCGQSKRKFVVKPDIPGQDETCLELFSFLGLVESEVDSFYTCFTDIDIRKTGNIQPVELFSYFSIDLSPFEAALFSVFDDDSSGKLTFLEFVCSLWNLLSMPVSLLGALIYMIKDHSGVLRIRYSDVKDVVELMHKKRVEGAPTLQTIVGDLKNNYSAELSIQDLCKWSQNNQSILSPIIILQLKFRRQILGEKYWQAASEARFADPVKGSVVFIKDLFKLMRTKSEEVRQKRELKQRTMKAQSRNANLTGAQSNIARKQSILLSNFGLSQQPQQMARQASSKQMGLDANVNSDIKVKSKPTSSSSLLDPSPKKNAAAAVGAVVPTNIVSASWTSSKSNKNLNNSSSKKSKSTKTLTLDALAKAESKEKDDDDKGNINRDLSMATMSMSSKRPQSAKQAKKSSSKTKIEKSDSNGGPDSPGAGGGGGGKVTGSGSPVVTRPKSAAARSNSKRNLSREDSKVSIKSSNGRKSSITA